MTDTLMEWRGLRGFSHSISIYYGLLVLFRLDGPSVAVMTRIGVSEAYSNDLKHLGKMDFFKQEIQIIF